MNNPTRAVTQKINFGMDVRFILSANQNFSNFIQTFLSPFQQSLLLKNEMNDLMFPREDIR